MPRAQISPTSPGGTSSPDSPSRRTWTSGEGRPASPAAPGASPRNVSIPPTSVWPYPPIFDRHHGVSDTVIMPSHSGEWETKPRDLRSYLPPALAATTASIIWPNRNAWVHASASTSRHTSSASKAGVKTFVPPASRVARQNIIVPTWNSGPLLRKVKPGSICRTCSRDAACATSAAWLSRAAFGRPSNAAVYIASTGAASPDTPSPTRPGGPSSTRLGTPSPTRPDGPSPAPAGAPLARNRSYSSPESTHLAAPDRTDSAASVRSHTTTFGVRSPSTNASSSGDCRQFAGQKTAPIRAAASRSSRTRWEFRPSHSTRSPWPTPSEASAPASRSTRSSSAG